MKRDHIITNKENFSSTGSSSCSSKAKMWSCEADDGGVDELFALLGYNMKSSDMAEVAQKIQQLEEVMGTVQQEGLSQLASETVHYNPSDISSWLESMITGLYPVPGFDSSSDPFLESSTVDHSSCSVNSRTHTQMTVDLDFGSDLVAIPEKVVYPKTQPPPPNQHQPQTKKLKPSPYPGNLIAALPIEPLLARPSESALPVLLVDWQENGVRLVQPSAIWDLGFW
ncbi:hypothetical protein ACS0TY_014367 [Phlomoides rotata]